MAAILAERELAFLHPVARVVGGPAVREAATVGGNLFAPSPYGDFAAALLALDATVMFAGGFGQREVPLEEFLAQPRPQRHAWSRASRSAARRADVPLPQGNARPAQRHLGAVDRRPAAASGGRVTGARIAYGAMAKTPMRAKAAERALEGRALDAAGVAPALAVAAEGTAPATTPSPAPGGAAKSLAVHLRRLLARRRPSMRQPMKTPIQFRLNGEDVAVFVDGGANLLDALREAVGDMSRQVRLLAGHLRHLHRADRRRRRSFPA